MLTRDELFRQAAARGLPTEKAQGIVREYFQYLILQSINTCSDQMVLTGGTALRLVYNLGRLSFDLDFDAAGLSRDGFSSIIERVQNDLTRVGAEATIGRLKQRQNILTAEIKVVNAFKLYGIETPAEKLMVKVEVLNVSTSRLQPEVKLVRNFDGQTILINVLKLEYLATEKVAAFFERARERDYYDVLFLMINKAPVNAELLNTIVSEGDFIDNNDVMDRILQKFKHADLGKISRKLEPFLIDPGHGQMIQQSEKFLSDLMK